MFVAELVIALILGGAGMWTLSVLPKQKGTNFDKLARQYTSERYAVMREKELVEARVELARTQLRAQKTHAEVLAEATRLQLPPVDAMFTEVNDR